ncbi:MAG: hypothetical protein JWP35_2928 [Caulobacter sp.]|nr:hypothetical protein [Caulobacter sp.]
MTGWAGKTAFITGGASGIGLGMAEAFAQAGMAVTISDIEEAALAAAVAGLAAKGHQVDSLALDVRDLAAFRSAAASVMQRHGRIDILCNNAGVVFERSTADWTDTGWRWLLDVNLMGVVHGLQAFLPAFKAQGFGHIVNTASLTGLLGRADIGQYGSSKFAIVGLSQCMREELAGHGVGVLALCPGMVMTRIMDATRNAPRDVTARLAAAGLSDIPFTPPAPGGPRGVTEAVEVGRMVLDAIVDDVFYVLTDLTWADDIEREQARLRGDIAWLARREAATA